MAERRRKPQRKVTRWVERAALGAIMGAVAWVVERRITKALRRRDQDPQPRRRPPVELSAAAEQVDQQAGGQR